MTEGVSGFSLDKVRRAGSFSGSQLTHYFSDRQALIRAVVERQIETVLEFHRQPALAGLRTFDDFERWAGLNPSHLRRVGYRGTPTYHKLVGQLAKSDGVTRQTLAAGYWRWVSLLEGALQEMRSAGLLTGTATPQQLALVAIAGHQGGGTVAFAQRQEWPLSDACRFVVNHVRAFASDPDERRARPPVSPHRDRRHGHLAYGEPPRYTRKGVATRARIVSGAADLMFERGANRTSLEDVRKALAVSGSQLSHYFEGKRDLTREVVALRAHDVLEFQSPPGLGGASGVADLRRWVDAYVAEVETQYARGGCVYGSLVGELLEGDDEVLDDLASGYDEWLRELQRGLSAMRRRGELDQRADLRHLAVTLLVAHQGGAMLTYVIGSAEPLRLALDAAVDYVASFSRSPA
ncbi:TetR family transcriptional regulator (plasmid) [Mycolicibacterium arabiense]|uniref:TetR family transcriptional regulator n=1 Tax=Mycolicibacterium arabiense TaxID=1286181 RepID=A0A7I7RSL7_9MYCO|nr:TetR family transcriptional regulator [Mycolicibacterium arabiense]